MKIDCSVLWKDNTHFFIHQTTSLLSNDGSSLHIMEKFLHTRLRPNSPKKYGMGERDEASPFKKSAFCDMSPSWKDLAATQYGKNWEAATGPPIKPAPFPTCSLLKNFLSFWQIMLFVKEYSSFPSAAISQIYFHTIRHLQPSVSHSTSNIYAHFVQFILHFFCELQKPE